MRSELDRSGRPVSLGFVTDRDVRRRHDPDPDFGPALRAARSRLGWSLGDLARAAQISEGYVSRLENGRRAPSVVTVFRLTGVLVLNSAERSIFTRAAVAGVGHDYDRLHPRRNQDGSRAAPDDDGNPDGEG